MKAVIIDDIPQAVDLLRKDLAEFCPQVEVIGDASGVVSGAKLLKQLQPDVVFLDIELQDGTGFDLLEIVGGIPFKVIFTTASDEHAIRAFRFSAIDYLLKPINPEDLQQAVAKANTQPDSPERIDLLLDVVKASSTPRKLALHTLDKIQVADIKDIVRCESSGNYTTFYFTDGQNLLVTKTLKEFEKLLDGHGFIRVHQSHLVNVDQIKEYIKTEGGYLVMKDGAHVSVSVRKKPLVVKLLDQL